ncbi:MAG: hypothetical protein F4X35_09625, partial [Alphaproteobacteria bacterium]|nr:hypothetical protein [Alphaproteobacteria bacterium]
MTKDSPSAAARTRRERWVLASLKLTMRINPPPPVPAGSTWPNGSLGASPPMLYPPSPAPDKLAGVANRRGSCAMPFEAVPLSGSFGAEVRGVDLGSLDDAGFAGVHAALLDHGVVCFRDQELDAQAYLAFAKRWGDIHLHPHLKGLDDRPEIIEIVREADDPTGFADHWHTDQSFTPTPAMATLLYAK